MFLLLLLCRASARIFAWGENSSGRCCVKQKWFYKLSQKYGANSRDLLNEKSKTLSFTGEVGFGECVCVRGGYK